MYLFSGEEIEEPADAAYGADQALQPIPSAEDLVLNSVAAPMGTDSTHETDPVDDGATPRSRILLWYSPDPGEVRVVDQVM